MRACVPARGRPASRSGTDGHRCAHAATDRPGGAPSSADGRIDLALPCSRALTQTQRRQLMVRRWGGRLRLFARIGKVFLLRSGPERPTQSFARRARAEACTWGPIAPPTQRGHRRRRPPPPRSPPGAPVRHRLRPRALVCVFAVEKPVVTAGGTDHITLGRPSFLSRSFLSPAREYAAQDAGAASAIQGRSAGPVLMSRPGRNPTFNSNKRPARRRAAGGMPAMASTSARLLVEGRSRVRAKILDFCDYPRAPRAYGAERGVWDPLDRPAARCAGSSRPTLRASGRPRWRTRTSAFSEYRTLLARARGGLRTALRGRLPVSVRGCYCCEV